MEMTGVQKLAQVLRFLVIVVFVCNLVALLLVPVMAMLTPGGAAEHLLGLAQLGEDDIFIPFWVLCVAAWGAVWYEAYPLVLTLFLWACGICTAIILWQGKRGLDTILKGGTFTLENAVNLKRAAVCSFVISGAALLRTIWGLCYYRSAGPLLTYNTLFIPAFLVAGLACMVMSALFRQAAEMKADQDLTI